MANETAPKTIGVRVSRWYWRRDRKGCPGVDGRQRDGVVRPLPEARKLTAGINGADIIVLDAVHSLATPDQPCVAREVRLWPIS